MIGALAAAFLLLVGAVILGNGAVALMGAPRLRAAAPLLGLAIMVVAATALIRLPGHVLVPQIVLCAACVGVVVWLRRGAVAISSAQALGALLVVAAGAIPFVVAGRFGIPGVGLNNDLAFHLLIGSELAEGREAALAPWLAGYPIGGHALSATLAIVGPGVLPGFVGVMLAVPVLGAMTGAAMFSGISTWRATGVGLLVGATYPVLVWAGQGRLKEPIVAMLIVGLVAVLRNHSPAASARSWGVPGILIGAMVLVYGPGALVPVAVLGLVLLAARLWRPSLGALNLSLRGAAWLAGAVLVCVLPMVDRLIALNPVSAAEAQAVGGPQESLAPIAALGAWPTRDFRYSPVDLGMVSAPLLAGATAIAVLAVLLGLLVHVVRRDVVIVAALVGVGASYLLAQLSQGPYVTSKTVVLASPVLALLVAGCLLAPWRSMTARLATTALGVLALVVSAASASTTLSYTPVGPLQAVDAMEAFRVRTDGSQVLVLVDDDYAPWALRGAAVTPLYPYMVTPAIAITPVARKMTPWGPAVDLDSIASQDLRRFRFVVAPRAVASSAPPPGWDVVQESGPVALLESMGRQAPRSSRETGLNWSVPLSCRDVPAGAVALPLRDPVLRGAEQWVRAGGPAFPLDGVGLTLLPAGDRATITIPLTPGRYAIDLAYRAGHGLEVLIGGASHSLMPLLTMSRTPMHVGEIDWPGGDLVVEARPANLDGARRAPDAALGALRVVRLPRPASATDARDLCGRPADWVAPRP